MVHFACPRTHRQETGVSAVSFSPLQGEPGTFGVDLVGSRTDVRQDTDMVRQRFDEVTRDDQVAALAADDTGQIARSEQPE